VTLEELTAALETVFARQRERQERIAQKIAEPQIDFKLELSEFDIERAMEELYRKVKKVADSERMALFSAVTAKETAEKLIFSFVALLHLAQKGRLHIFQEKFFGEIFIRMPQEIKSTVRAVSHGS
jgi:chromatin segregation and condensation protein Rec8/ScpA/Scc1 (kleisin family)